MLELRSLNVVPIITRKYPKVKRTKSVATPPKGNTASLQSEIHYHQVQGVTIGCYIRKRVKAFGNGAIAPTNAPITKMGSKTQTGNGFLRHKRNGKIDLLSGTSWGICSPIQYPFKNNLSTTNLFSMLQPLTNSCKGYWHRRLSHLNFDYINLLSKKDIVIGLPKLKYVKDQLCSSCEVSKAKRSSFKSKTVPSSIASVEFATFTWIMWSHAGLLL
ncbi:retrovirus-related pol polyprotein from transposon TNT 1-94 [Tanacetum coccineum]